jgi:hypothetical protein
MRLLPKIISGGQTGVDQAAIAAARRAGLATGGYVPKGWLTEDGPAPWLQEFGLCELPKSDYPSRTRKNVAVSDATLWLGDSSSDGGQVTCNTARRVGKPLYIAESDCAASASEIADWLESLAEIQVLNIAGNRESLAPGIRERSERIFTDLFSLLRTRGWRGAE